LIPHPDNCKQSKGAIKATITGGTTPYLYTWSSQNTFPDSISNILGPTRVYVTVTDNNGCSAMKSDSIENTGSPSFSILKIDSSCAGANQGLIALQPLSNDGPFYYVWSNDTRVHDSVAKKLAPGNYTVSAYNSLNCPEIITATVPAYAAGFFDLGIDQTITVGEKALIEIKTDAPYNSLTWNQNTTIGTNINGSIFAYPTATTTYTATITYGVGCKLSDKITIYVDSLKDSIDIPNVFTPNGDGVNDEFYIRTVNIERLSIRIYNRWGERVFQGFDTNFSWNGKNPKGESLSDGNYSYTILYKSYNSPSDKTLSGYITLIN
jgi:gliding motility-associated-like protein